MKKPIDSKNDVLLKVKDINMLFKTRGSFKNILKNISFDVNEGDFFGIIGESGSGKTTIGKVIMRMYQASGGIVEFKNQLISQKKISLSKNKWIKKNIQMIFQDPMSSMNPIKNVLKIVSEPLIINGIARKETIEYIKTITKINNYFKNNFNKENLLNFFKFKNNYLNKCVDIYQKWIDYLNNYDNNSVENLLIATEIVDSLLNNLIDQLEINLEKSYEFIYQQKELINKTINRFNNNDLDQYDIMLYNSKNKINELKKLKFSSEKLNNLKNELKKNKNEFNKKSKVFFNLYLNEIESYKKAIFLRLQSNIKSYVQLKNSSSNNVQFLYFQLNEYIQKLIKKIVLFIFKNNNYLSIDDVEKTIIDVEEFINNEFEKYLFELIELENKFNVASISEKSQILDSLSKFKNLFNSIKKISSLPVEHEIYSFPNGEYEKRKFDIFINEIFNKYIKFESKLNTKFDLSKYCQDIQYNKDIDFSLIESKNISYESIRDINNILIATKNKLINHAILILNSNFKNKKIDQKYEKEIFNEINNHFINLFENDINNSKKLIDVIKNNKKINNNLISNYWNDWIKKIDIGYEIFNYNLVIINDSLENKRILINKLDNNKFVINYDELTFENSSMYDLDIKEKYFIFLYDKFIEFKKISDNRHIDFLIEKYDYNFDQNKILDEINEEKNVVKSSFNFIDWNKKIIDEINNKKIIIDERNVDIKNFKDDLVKNFNPIIEKNKQEIKNIQKKLKIIKKEFKRTIVNFLNFHSNKDVDKENSIIDKLKRWNTIKVIRKSLNQKWRTQEAIDYQYRNSINRWRLNTLLYSSNKLTGYIYYPWIRNLIIKEKVYESLRSVGLKHEHAYRYPHEFSGGQRQRIVIARALITKPKLIIADEPISALDVSIQSQVVNIMKDLAQKNGVTFLFIAHDLSMISYSCNKMIIMHNGRIVEKGNVEKIFKNPIHPYTKCLFKSIPDLSRIHVNLAHFDDNLDYDKQYSPINKPKYWNVDDSGEHQIFCVDEQYNEWCKN